MRPRGRPNGGCCQGGPGGCRHALLDVVVDVLVVRGPDPVGPQEVDTFNVISAWPPRFYWDCCVFCRDAASLFLLRCIRLVRS